MNPGPVVVDLQSIQSPDARERGSCAYAYELAVALEREHPHLVGRYLLNPDLLPPGDLGSLLSSGKVAYAADAPMPAARILHVLSPFAPGVRIDRIWPRWAHEQGLRFCVTVCHPIPGRYQGSSLAQLRDWTESAGVREVLRNADALLAISPAQSRFLASNLGIDPGRVHMVGAGTKPRFTPAASRESALGLAKAVVPELGPSFVLCPATRGEPENLELLIVSFASLPAALRDSRQLLITGCSPAAASHLEQAAATEGIAAQVLCTRAMPTESMARLYQASELVCFPSLVGRYEPAVAEAMACGAVVIVADVDLLRDLAAPEARFSPASPAAISELLERGLSDEAFRHAAREHASATRSTWADVANRTAAVYEALLARPGRPWHRRRRVAIVSPFPPVASGVANYSFRLVEELATLGDLDIDCFADGLEFSPEPPRVPSGLDVYDARRFLGVEAATGGYDEVVYVLGNSEFHAAALAALHRRHGTVLAHDVRLSGLYRFAADSAPVTPGSATSSLRRIYGQLVPDEPGAPGDGAATIAQGHDLLMAREVIGLADRFLVTSQAAARLACLDAGPSLTARVGVVGFATEALRTRASSASPPTGAEGARVLASFGIVDPIKQPDKVLRCFAALTAAHPDLVVALVGPISAELAENLGRLGTELGLDGRLFITGRVDAALYLDWLRRAEVAVQLRASFSGEASAAVGDCLSHGLPMIVTEIGWMAELPDDAAVKVPVDITPVDLAEACDTLLGDRAARDKLRKGALDYAHAHSFKLAARSLLDMLDKTAVSDR